MRVPLYDFLHRLFAECPAPIPFRYTHWIIQLDRYSPQYGLIEGMISYTMGRSNIGWVPLHEEDESHVQVVIPLRRLRVASRRSCMELLLEIVEDEDYGED